MVERAGAGLVAGLALALLSMGSGPARAADKANDKPANDKQVCLSSYEDAQRLRFANKLLGAREKLRLCRRDVCPNLVRNDCEKWLGEVAESLPSVVLSARDPSGKDLFDVKVTVDGAPLTTGLDGTAVDVDPGTHTIVFVRGADTKEEKLLVRQGEHNRVIVGVLGQAKASAPGGERDDRGPGPQRVAGLVVGAAGLVGLGVGGVLGLTSNADAGTLHDTCGPTRSCTQDQVDEIAGRRTLAGVVAGIGGAALVTGVVLFLTAPNAASTQALGPRERRASWWTLGAGPVPGGAQGSLRASF